MITAMNVIRKIFAPLAAAALFLPFSCAQKPQPQPDPQPDPDPREERVMIPISGIRVTIDGSYLYDYAFTYDDSLRVQTATLSRWTEILREERSGCVPFNYGQSYEGKKFKNRSSGVYCFKTEEGNVSESSFACILRSVADKGLELVGEASITSNIKYTEREDVSNIGALFVTGDFIPFYMKGYPSNKYLVSEIETISSNAGTPRHRVVEYKINPVNGTVKTATVSDYRGKELQHTYVYTFKY